MDVDVVDTLATSYWPNGWTDSDQTCMVLWLFRLWLASLANLRVWHGCIFSSVAESFLTTNHEHVTLMFLSWRSLPYKDCTGWRQCGPMHGIMFTIHRSTGNPRGLPLTLWPNYESMTHCYTSSIPVLAEPHNNGLAVKFRINSRFTESNT